MQSYKSRATRNQRRQRKLLEQKLIGIGLLVITGLMVWMCGGANEDCGAAIITAPLGLILLLDRKIWLW